MELAKGIDESTEEPSIPEKVRRFIHQNLRGLTQIVVREETAKGKHKQLNKITLQNKAGDFPDEDAQEICIGIMRVIEARDDEREEIDPPITFQIMGDVREKDGTRKRPSLEYEFISGGSPDDYGLGDDNYDNPLRQMMDAQTHYISTLHYHLDESHTVIRDIANNNQQAMKPLMDALGWMGHFYASGLQNQQAAFAMIYDVKRAEAEEKGKTQRTEKWLEMLKKPVGAMGAQFIPWAMAKMTGQEMVAVEDDDEDDEDDDETPTTVTVENMEEDLGLTEHQTENPIATYASALGMCLEAEQWFEISDLLKKKEIRVLRELIQAENDKDCVAAYDAFGEIPLTRLAALNAKLTEEQRDMLTQLGELVKAMKEKWGE